MAWIDRPNVCCVCGSETIFDTHFDVWECGMCETEFYKTGKGYTHNKAIDHDIRVTFDIQESETLVSIRYGHNPDIHSFSQ